MSCLASATVDCKQSTEVTAVMARASAVSFHVYRFGIFFQFETIHFWVQRRNDALRAGIERWHTEQGRPGVTSYSRFFLFLRFSVFNDAMTISSLYDWLRPGLW
jgi:hypothetical protein